MPTISNSMQSSKLQSEIDRVANKSGINPTSVDCRNVEFAQICYAEYSSISGDQAKQMLISSGYTLVDEEYNRNGEISAANQGAKTRVDTERNYTESTTLTLKFKDINVTL